MRCSNATLKQFILEAIISMLKEKNLKPGEPLEYYVDDIMLRSLSNCTNYFLKRKGLRPSEQHALITLQNDINDNTDLTLIEEKLIKNLAKIKPIWGELFGTDRGQVYNILIALKDWSCFTWHARLYYKQQMQRRNQKQLFELHHVLSQQRQQLVSASQSILQHETTTQSLAKRAASQFITIQKLRKENKSLTKTLDEKKPSTPKPVKPFQLH